MTVWVSDRKWHWIHIFAKIWAFKGGGLLISWWTAYFSLMAVCNKLLIQIPFLSHSHFFFLHFKALLRTFLRSNNAKCEFLQSYLDVFWQGHWEPSEWCRNLNNQCWFTFAGSAPAFVNDHHDWKPTIRIKTCKNTNHDKVWNNNYHVTLSCGFAILTVLFSSSVFSVNVNVGKLI